MCSLYLYPVKCLRKEFNGLIGRTKSGKQYSFLSILNGGKEFNTRIDYEGGGRDEKPNKRW